MPSKKPNCSLEAPTTTNLRTKIESRSCLCLSLPPTTQDLTQSLFYSGGFREGGGWAWAKIHALLDYVGHRFTGCNVCQMTLLDLDSRDVTGVQHLCLLIAWTRPKSLVLCCAVNDIIDNLQVAQLKSGTIQPQIYHWPWSPIQHEYQMARLKSWVQQAQMIGTACIKKLWFTKLYLIWHTGCRLLTCF